MTRHFLCVLLAFVVSAAAMQVQVTESLLRPELMLAEVAEGVVMGTSCVGEECSNTYVCTDNCAATQKRNCLVDGWSEWTSCSSTCGPDGVTSRTRVVVQTAQNGGVACPALEQSLQCNNIICSQDCVVSNPSAWTACSSPCGGGTKSQIFTITRYPYGNGRACPSLTITENCNTQPCPASACTYGEWTAYNACSQPCGATGTQIFTRKAVTGTNCPTGVGLTTKTVSCNTQIACKVNCTMNAWTQWGECSSSCTSNNAYAATPQTSRTRTVNKAASPDGKACPLNLFESRPCNEDIDCPVDCEMTEWTEWGTCSGSCFNDENDYVYQTRSRSVSVEPRGGGLECGTTDDIQPCDVSFCPIDCEQGSWGEYSACTVSCGGGIETRTRPTVREANYGGKACGESSESRACNSFVCPLDCLMSSWAGWGACSAECTTKDGVSGTHIRDRQVVRNAVGTGAPCPTRSQREPCNLQPCSVDCQLSTWTAWGGCSKSCVPQGDYAGRQTRSRKITQEAGNGGSQCGCLEEERECNLIECPIDCRLTEWSDFSACSAPCRAEGTAQAPRMFRFRKIIQFGLFGGKSCSHEDNYLYNYVDCNTQYCKRDCTVSSWEAFSPVCPSCHAVGTSQPTQTRSRSVVITAASGGIACPTQSETISCEVPFCPIDCVLNAWAAWEKCSADCGEGYTTRTRTVKTAPLYGGKACDVQSESKWCDNLPECDESCILSQWLDWSECSKSCREENGAAGTMFRNRTILAGPEGAAAKCGTLEQVQNCQDIACPIDCEVTAWSEFGVCTAGCGGGYQQRVRSISKSPNAAGKRCPALRDLRACGNEPCKQDCVLSEWGQFGPCSKPCDDSTGAGEMTRRRLVLIAAAFGGKECDVLTNTLKCNAQRCPIDCKVGDWSDLGSCSAVCGDSFKNQIRHVITPFAYGGQECPALLQQVRCNVPDCAIQCNVSQWRVWGPCSKTCGGGSRERTREVLIGAANGAALCPATLETQSCNNNNCPQDCVVSLWGPWSSCNVDGVKRRSRTITTYANYGGKPCPECLTEKDHCESPMPAEECLVQPCAEEEGRADYESKDSQTLPAYY